MPRFRRRRSLAETTTKTFAALVLAAGVALSAAGCVATSEAARARSPFFPGGPRGCWSVCRASGMEMAAFTYHGEYGSTCTCRPHAAGGTMALVDPDAPGPARPPFPPGDADELE